MIQQSPVLAAIKKGVTARVLSELEKRASSDPEAYLKVWDTFGPVLKEGLYEDFERRAALLDLARFHTTTSAGGWRSLADYTAGLKENQTAIYYVTGTDLDRIATAPQLEGFRARGVEVLLLSDPIDNFWVTAGVDYQGKPFRSVTQGSADLALIPLLEGSTPPATEASGEVSDFLAFVKTTLAEDVSDVRASDRLTESAVCLVATESGMDRQLERMLASAGQAPPKAKPVLEVNPQHELIVKLAGLGEGDTLRADAAHLLFDEAQIADGEQPVDPRAFAARLARVLTRALG